MEGAVKEVAAEVHVVEVATELEKMEAVEAPAASPPEELVAPMADAKMAEEEKAMEGMERERRHPVRSLKRTRSQVSAGICRRHVAHLRVGNRQRAAAATESSHRAGTPSTGS